ncbi:MAG: hypothetical protein NW206_20910 [Hyphomonadaceae bacterium]|nr:hypothetical protein [Hyphomonadaceae bacterium]
MPGVLAAQAFRSYQQMAKGGELYRELSAGFESSRRAAQHTPTRRETIAQFVDVAYALAATILQAPADYPAHAVDFAIGLLNEAMTYVQAEMTATQEIAEWGC